MTAYYTLADANGSMRVSLHAPEGRPAGMPGGAEALCVLRDERVVLVQPHDGRLNTPGGMPQEGEGSATSMIRAVRDQAGAEVTSWQLIAFARSEILEGDRAGQVLVRDMYLARVELLPWEPRDARIAGRQMVHLNDLASIMSADWPGLDHFSAELVALAHRALSER